MELVLSLEQETFQSTVQIKLCLHNTKYFLPFEYPLYSNSFYVSFAKLYENWPSTKELDSVCKTGYNYLKKDWFTLESLSYEYSGDLKSEHLKPRLFEGQISNGPVFEWLGFTFTAIVPTIRKPDHSKSRRFCLDFKWFLTKWRPFVQISNG